MSRSPDAPGVDGVSFGQIEELGTEVGGRAAARACARN